MRPIFAPTQLSQALAFSMPSDARFALACLNTLDTSGAWIPLLLFSPFSLHAQQNFVWPFLFLAYGPA